MRQPWMEGRGFSPAAENGLNFAGGADVPLFGMSALL
jgi:hypothetical protein